MHSRMRAYAYPNAQAAPARLTARGARGGGAAAAAAAGPSLPDAARLWRVLLRDDATACELALRVAVDTGVAGARPEPVFARLVDALLRAAVACGGAGASPDDVGRVCVLGVALMEWLMGCGTAAAAFFGTRARKICSCICEWGGFAFGDAGCIGNCIREWGAGTPSNLALFDALDPSREGADGLDVISRGVLAGVLASLIGGGGGVGGGGGGMGGGGSSGVDSATVLQVCPLPYAFPYAPPREMRIRMQLVAARCGVARLQVRPRVRICISHARPHSDMHRSHGARMRKCISPCRPCWAVQRRRRRRLRESRGGGMRGLSCALRLCVRDARLGWRWQAIFGTYPVACLTLSLLMSV